MLSRVTAIGAILVVALLVAITWSVAAGAPRGERVNDVVDAWLREMALPSGDRGWMRLSETTQARVYGGDAQAYYDDLRAVDWTTVGWDAAEGRLDDGAFWMGSVALRSHPSTLPRFLLQRGLAQPMCIDDLPFGIAMSMPVDWFAVPRIHGGGIVAGSSDRCLAAFEHDPGPVHDPFDLVGGAWGSPGPNQRVGVKDRTGMVIAVGPGREDPPIVGEVGVALFEPRKLAISWLGSSCDANSLLVVGRMAGELDVRIDRGLRGDECAPAEVIYEIVLELSTDVSEDQVKARLGP